jgi:inorganic pyrophosphatase
VAAYAAEKANRPGIHGDGDPLDICVLTEKTISHSDIILKAIPIGGFRMIDKGEADDKIIAVLENDSVFGNWKDIENATTSVIERLRHYFLTYKNIPGDENRLIEITEVYGREQAWEVINRSILDYKLEISV